MKEVKNKVLLDEENFQTAISATVHDIVKGKKEKEEYLGRISEEKEILKSLKEELKKLKKKIKITKRALRNDKKNLRKTEAALRIKNNTMIQISNGFISEEQTFVDSTNYSIIKKR